MQRLFEKKTLNATFIESLTAFTYPVYGEYKTSSIEWLGDVPKHWEVLSIKRLTPVQRGASPRPIEDPKYFDDDGEYAWVRIADVTSNDHYLIDSTQRLSDLGKSLSVPLEPGTLFLSIAGSVGKPMITAIKACIHDGFVHFPHLQINPEFLYYIFDSGQPYLGLGKLGTQLNLNTDTVGGIKIGLPPKEEQDAIAAFLDRKTGQIDALIAKKKELMGKLKEKRLAVITQAVTKGLDPAVVMRDSGTPWLEAVPEHWEMKRLKFYAERVFTGSTPPSDASQYYEEPTVNWFTPSDFTDDGAVISDAKRKLNVIAVAEGVVRFFDCRCALIVGIGATLGRIGFTESPFSCNQQINVVIPTAHMDAKFLYYSLLAKRETLKVLSNSTTLGILNQETTRQIEIPAPKINEQIQVVEFLDLEVQKIDALIVNIDSAIARLTEYRTALITAATTGKIDVRQVAVPTAT